MILKTVKQLNYHCARTWVKIQSASGPYIYTLGEREVSNNRPHIKLERYQRPQPPPQPSLASMMGFVMPSEEEDDEAEDES